MEILKPEVVGKEPPPSLPGETSKTLIHPLSAMILVGIDSLWTLAEWNVLAWIITIPLSFVAVFVPVILIQKFINRDGSFHSIAVASSLAVLAAVPMPITGTVAGMAILAYAGVKKFWFLPGKK
ncbi:MAG: hypothetical protein SFY92_09640 [Verrucomicrobiae bacterium]|nr:hypothetical protein [Verrucomicrobiae bacterium]